MKSVANVSWLSNITIREGRRMKLGLSSLEIDNITNPKGPNLDLSPKKRNTSWLAVEFSVGGFFGWRAVHRYVCLVEEEYRRDKEDDHALDEKSKRGTKPRRFSYNELARATNDFNDKEKRKARTRRIWWSSSRIFKGLRFNCYY
ncbi:hypothetical protein CFP56_021909 [Quercus suber]|uniref:Uncharacterized protein n=1 Tax=Quercus suber TaxID=58331 RepID=A0AAW0KE20_QUESU